MTSSHETAQRLWNTEALTLAIKTFSGSITQGPMEPMKPLDALPKSLELDRAVLLAWDTE